MKMPRPAILVVDNDESIVEILCLMLVKHGYQCVAASTCDEGLRQFGSNIRLVITDLNMPGDGVSMIKSIRSVSKVPIVIVSAFQPQYSGRLRATSNMSWLPKPIEFDSLLNLVDLALTQNRSPRAARCRV
jgi:DNA-binding response OmpR family regulator